MNPTNLITYKKIGHKEVKLHVFEPAAETKKPMPVIIFFFGGGWRDGTPKQFYHHSNYFAKHGIFAISAEYRTEKNGGVKPSECVKDGKAAVRYVRAHAKELGIDPDKIIVGGGSAGGHVAAATGTVKGYEHEDEDFSLSSCPNAMVLFNPVYDNSENGYGYDRVKDHWESFSPFHNITEKTPPAIVFFGSEEKFVKIPKTTDAFQAKMKKFNIKSELFIYNGQSHGFFHYKNDNGLWFLKTMTETHRFLREIQYLSSMPNVDKYITNQSNTSEY